MENYNGLLSFDWETVLKLEFQSKHIKTHQVKKQASYDNKQLICNEYETLTHSLHFS